MNIINIFTVIILVISSFFTVYAGIEQVPVDDAKDISGKCLFI